MTTDERLDRMTAALFDERRKDREEYRQLWRDNQRQINDLTLKIADTNDAVARLTANVDRLTEETRISDKRARSRTGTPRPHRRPGLRHWQAPRPT